MPDITTDVRYGVEGILHSLVAKLAESRHVACEVTGRSDEAVTFRFRDQDGAPYTVQIKMDATR